MAFFEPCASETGRCAQISPCAGRISPCARWKAGGACKSVAVRGFFPGGAGEISGGGGESWDGACGSFGGAGEFCCVGAEVWGGGKFVVDAAGVGNIMMAPASMGGAKLTAPNLSSL